MREPTAVIVTGAGSGIGRAIALRLAEDGINVGIVGRTASKLRVTMRTIEKAGITCAYECADVRIKSQVKSAFKQLVKKLGGLRGAVACAGVGGSNDPRYNDRWDTIIKTNLYGTYHTLCSAVELMNHKCGHSRQLVALSSLLARIGVPNYTAYCASKSGILGLVRAMAVELAEREICVNAICPGWVSTPMSTRGVRALAKRQKIAPDQAREQALESVPLRRMSNPSEIAALVSFLFSEEVISFTGQAFDVSNGSWMD